MSLTPQSSPAEMRDYMPVHDRGSVMRVGTYRLAPGSRRLVYRWEGWQ